MQREILAHFLLFRANLHLLLGSHLICGADGRLRSCVKVEVAVLGSRPSLIVLVACVDVTEQLCL